MIKFFIFDYTNSHVTFLFFLFVLLPIINIIIVIVAIITILQIVANYVIQVKTTFEDIFSFKALLYLLDHEVILDFMLNYFLIIIFNFMNFLSFKLIHLITPYIIHFSLHKLTSVDFFLAIYQVILIINLYNFYYFNSVILLFEFIITQVNLYLVLGFYQLTHILNINLEYMVS